MSAKSPRERRSRMCTLGVVVRRDRSGSDRVDAELGRQLRQLGAGHERILPREGRAHTRGRRVRTFSATRTSTIPSPEQGEVLVSLRAAGAEPSRRVGAQGAPVGSEAAHPRRRRLRRGRRARRRRRRLRRRRTRRREPGHPARRADHGDRRAHGRHVLRAQGDSGCPAVSARRRALVRGGSGVPAHLRDRATACSSRRRL